MRLIHFLTIVTMANIFSCGIFDEKDDSPPFSSPIVYSNTKIIWGEDSELVEINRDLVFDHTTSLTILPGTKIQYDEGTVLIKDPAGDMLRPPVITILGDFIAEGEENDPIEFLLVGDERPSLHIDGENASNRRIELVWVTGIGYLPIKNCSPIIRHCDIRSNYFEYCDSANISDNQFFSIHFWYSSGLVKANQIVSGVFSLSGSLRFESNRIGLEEKRYRGIYSSHDDVSIFVNNTIDNYEEAIYVFSGSPTFNQNNITNYDVAINIIPFSGEPESDTLNFSDNWWGSTNESEISGKILYSRNFDTISEKIIIINPVASVPFE
ncbi:MAG: hypothetical protein HQ556_04275 [Candidatus Marinimicrobia bacterium]|nr:hypothetical protein [Candidatus Neomarinimicrobiota bacterium]